VNDLIDMINILIFLIDKIIKLKIKYLFVVRHKSRVSAPPIPFLFSLVLSSSP